ncbi:MAG: DNA-formamidopyrimidine glycosylase family protein, partial [Gaiellales bacterium]
MPEYPEVETVRRQLEASLEGGVIGRVGPVHVATLRTIEPPVSALAGRTFGAIDRRGKHLLLPTADGELVLHIHQMTAGRISVLEAAARRPRTAAFRLDLVDGRSLSMTERGSRKQARVGVYSPEAIAAELEHLGPEAFDITDAALADLLLVEGRRLHAFLRDQRALAGIGRAWANEILHRAKLSPYALTTELAEEQVR